MVIDLRQHYLESIEDIKDFVRFGQSEYRIVSGSKHLRNLLIDQLVLRINASIRIPLEFRFKDLSDTPAATKGMLAYWERMPVYYAAGEPPRSLQDFRRAKAHRAMDEFFSVETIIRVAANGTGGVHWDHVRNQADVDFVAATAGNTISDQTMDQFSMEASALPGIADVTVKSLEPLTHAVRARASL